VSGNKQPWNWIVGVSLAVGLGLILFPVFAHGGNRPTPAKACMSHLKQMAHAMNLYANLNDDRLPNRDHWMEVTVSYANSPDYFKDPEVDGKGQYGYAFNSRLSNQQRSSFPDAALLTMLFDSINLGRNASDPLASFPKPGRHNAANCVCYLDGHVKRISDPKK
jgi:hypothetical protein